MTEGPLAHVKGDFIVLRRRRIADDRCWVDEPPDEPDAGEPIDVRTWPGDPASVAIGFEGGGGHARGRDLAGRERLSNTRQVRRDEVPLWSVEEVDATDLSMLAAQPFKPLPQPRALLRFELCPQTLLQGTGLSLQRHIIIGPDPAEAFDEVGIGEPLKLFHPHHHCLPLRLLDLLG